MSFRSIRLIFNTRSSLDLLFNEREISSLYLFVYRLLLPHALKIRRTTEKYCTLFEKGNMFLGVHIHIYTG